MRKVFELIGWPGLALYQKYGLAAFGPVCTVLILATLLCAETLEAGSLRLGLIGILFVLCAYLFLGFTYYRQRHLSIGRQLLNRALVGDWKFEAKDVSPEWRKQGWYRSFLTTLIASKHSPVKLRDWPRTYSTTARKPRRTPIDS
jgi:hypothetical protein